MVVNVWQSPRGQGRRCGQRVFDKPSVRRTSWNNVYHPVVTHRFIYSVYQPGLRNPLPFHSNQLSNISFTEKNHEGACALLDLLQSYMNGFHSLLLIVEQMRLMHARSTGEQRSLGTDRDQSLHVFEGSWVLANFDQPRLKYVPGTPVEMLDCFQSCATLDTFRC